MRLIHLTFIAIAASCISQFVVAHGQPYSSPEAHKGAIQFAPGIITTDANFEINTVFNKSGDKVVFARCAKDFSTCTMMESSYKNNQWQTPQPLPFVSGYLEADPYFTPDFSHMYFISKRPITDGGEPTKSLNLWRVSVKEDDKGISVWGEPEYLPALSSTTDELYPSFAPNGDMYFPSSRDGERQLYHARAQGSGFAKPVAIPADVYGENATIGDSAISPDGKTIVFSISGRADSKGRGDLYISHWKDGKWTEAKSLGDAANSENHEFTPIMSPDGKYLFFTRIENGFGNLYQIHVSQLNW